MDRQKVRAGVLRPLKTKQRLTRRGKKKDKGKEKILPQGSGGAEGNDRSGVEWRAAGEQAEWFSSQFRSFYGSVLSQLEQDAVAGLFMQHFCYCRRIMLARRLGLEGRSIGCVFALLQKRISCNSKKERITAWII